MGLVPRGHGQPGPAGRRRGGRVRRRRSDGDDELPPDALRPDQAEGAGAQRRLGRHRGRRATAGLRDDDAEAGTGGRVTTNTAKAQLWKLDANGEAVKKFEVQFNPESLKVTFANQMQPANQGATDNSRGTSSTQYVGKGSTKLSVTLWFDVNAELPSLLVEGEDQRTDVRKLTGKVIDLIRTQPVTVARDQPIPPAVRFLWGTFKFDGLVESIEQSLDFFSSDGVPLRASISLNMTQQSIDYGFEPRESGAGPRAAPNLPSGAAPGTAPLTPAAAGATLQGMAAAVGKGASWPTIA